MMLIGIATPTFGAGSIEFILDPAGCGFAGDDTLTVHVAIDGAVSELQGFQLRLQYDPQALEVVSLSLGSLVAGSPCAFFPALLSTNGGVIEVDAAGLGCSVSGPGEILEIGFIGLTPRASELRCLSSQLRDSGNQPIPHTCPDKGIGYEVPQVSLLPSQNIVTQGTIVDIEVTVAAECDSFNAYEMTLAYDTAYLDFIALTPAEQEGALMTDACPVRFHQFQEAGGIITLTHSLLCAGVKAAGPGVAYNLRFQAGSLPAITTVEVQEFRFADSGIELPLPLTADATFQIGNPVGLPGDGEEGVARTLLYPAYPNPFQSSVRLAFSAAQEGPARVEVYSVSGHLIRVLFDEDVASNHRQALLWDGRDQGGRVVSSGMYLGRLITPDATRTTRFFKVR